jgi:hypothetical protein
MLNRIFMSANVRNSADIDLVATTKNSWKGMTPDLRGDEPIEHEIKISKCGQYDQQVRFPRYSARGWELWFRADMGRDDNSCGSCLPGSRSPRNA